MPNKFDMINSKWLDLAAARSLTLGDLFAVRQKGFDLAQLKVLSLDARKITARNVGISMIPGNTFHGASVPWLILETHRSGRTSLCPQFFLKNLNAPILYVPDFSRHEESHRVHYITGFDRKSHDPFTFLYDPSRSGTIYLSDKFWCHDEHQKSSPV